ncbi:MAG: hypothetical protein DCF30_20055 [Hyphomicrobiales bacterium]|nr:MAG: hypothetical protein DCF30_20055 [Hyphomicrobiales bacterium]
MVPADRWRHEGQGGLSFKDRLRDELLNKTLFSSLSGAWIAMAHWRSDDNTERPHARLGRQTPSVFASTSPRDVPGAAPRQAPRHKPVASSARTGSTTAGDELYAG